VVSTFKCRHCLREKSLNPRLKGRQSYCGESPCQRARKSEWKRMKMERDSDYRLNHYESNRAWRQSNQEYWRAYRLKHPDKEKRNRLLQKLRRIKAQNPSESGRVLSAATRPDVAKVDALLVEISSISVTCKELQRSTR